MSDIAPISRTSAAAVQTRMSVPAAPTAVETSPHRKADSVEFSEAARYLAKIAELPDIRQDLVDRVKGEIAAGTYDSEDKVDSMLDSLAEDLL
ncbi:Anti-sigma-28 factor, FlgM [Poriferisphaera corsica]|uniref:Anti-sigma-28 factor, FlgM n=2 Tax=Poriferisphaera corsica TaxID=2528020 RepID=A0A517YYV2_9BACT|nr:Anti-sigma-28 factor, FlgM [Poriferisphaera corsica]